MADVVGSEKDDGGSASVRIGSRSRWCRREDW